MTKKKKAADKNADRETLSFEEALERADQLVRELEDGTLGLTESLQKYEQGIGLLGQCFQMLDQAELKIAQLSGFDEQGRPVTVDFDAEGEQSLPEKARSRSRRRSADASSSSSKGGPRQNGGQASTGSPDRQTQNHLDEESVDESRGLF